MSSANPKDNPAENLKGQGTATFAAEPVLEQPGKDEEAADVNLGCVREVDVEIPAEVVSRQWDSTVQRYSKVARVPGFRKGKVPPSIVRSRFADEIKSDVLESLVPEYFRQAVVREGFKPVSQPEVHQLEMEAGHPIRFKAAFEILPDIQLGNYQDIKVDLPDITVTDEDVEAELKHLQERQSTFDPVNEDRLLQDGDFAQISFRAEAKEPAAESGAEEKSDSTEVSGQGKEVNMPVQMDEVLVEIAGQNTLPEFTANLRGAKAGEERTFEVIYPADHAEKSLAGKRFSYTAKINAIKKKTTPELTDEFAKELSSELQTLDDLKKRLREGIYAERHHKALVESRDKLLNQLADAHDFPIPETLIRRQIDLRLEQWLRALAAQGVRAEDMKRFDFKRLRASQRAAATKEVKANLLLERIAEAENIQVSDEELNQEIRILAQQANQTPEAVQQKLAQEGAMDRIRSRIRTDKALRFLYSKSTGKNGAVQE